MHYEYETGNCDYVDYQKYCDDMQEKNDIIQKLKIEKCDLEQTILEYQTVIEELKKLGEDILTHER